MATDAIRLALPDSPTRVITYDKEKHMPQFWVPVEIRIDADDSDAAEKAAMKLVHKSLAALPAEAANVCEVRLHETSDTIEIDD